MILESQFIRERCLKLIRKSSMHEDSWKWTVLDRCHDSIASVITLDENEYPLVSFYAGDQDWTLYTTHRLLSMVAGVRNEIKQSDWVEANFGNFKQSPDSPQITEATINSKHGSTVVLYESGYASMAAIQYFKFWSLKWPVWKLTYSIENEKEE